MTFCLNTTLSLMGYSDCLLPRAHLFLTHALLLSFNNIIFPFPVSFIGFVRLYQARVIRYYMDTSDLDKTTHTSSRGCNYGWEWTLGKAKRQKSRIFGHRNGVKAVRETIECAAEMGVKYLTLYAFSTENWSRPKDEVMGLMELLVVTINKEIKTLMENNIALKAIGDLESLPGRCHKELKTGH